MANVAILIPIYHLDLFEYEIISLSQCKKILGDYDLCYLIPKRLECSIQNWLNDGKIFSLDDSLFASTTSYNRMMMSSLVYSMFIEYDYILIYQLDAFVFKDELSYFCNLRYDYIGAPWIEGMINYKDIESFPVKYVGNGGLSLRNPKACIDVLETIFDIDYSINEDIFWSSQNGDDFRVAPIEVALAFSIERYAIVCYERNGRKKPFGCHQWNKYNLNFWKPFIEEQGYIVSQGMIENSSDDTNEVVTYDYLEKTDRKMIIDAIERATNTIYSDIGMIIIWGAGNKGKECGWLFLHNQIDIWGYVDINKTRRGDTLWNIKIHQPYEMPSKDEKIIIITPKGKDEEILGQIDSLGIINYKTILYSDIVREIKACVE